MDKIYTLGRKSLEGIKEKIDSLQLSGSGGESYVYMTIEVEPVETAFKEIITELKGSVPDYTPDSGFYDNIKLKFARSPGENTTEVYDLSSGHDNTVLMSGRDTGEEVILEIYPSDHTSTIISKDHINLQLQVIFADRYDFENLRFRPEGILDASEMFTKYYLEIFEPDPDWPEDIPLPEPTTLVVQNYVKEIKNLVFPDGVEIDMYRFISFAAIDHDVVIETENGGDIYPVRIHHAFYRVFWNKGYIMDLSRLNMGSYDFYDFEKESDSVLAICETSYSSPDKLYAQQWVRQSRKISKRGLGLFTADGVNKSGLDFKWKEHGGYIDRPRPSAVDEYYNGYLLTDQDVSSLNFIKGNIEALRDLVPNGSVTLINQANLNTITQTAMTAKYGGNRASNVPSDANITFKVIAKNIGEVDSFDWGGTILNRWDISAERDNTAQILAIDKGGNDMDFIATSYPKGGKKLKLEEDALKNLFYGYGMNKFTEIDLSGLDINSAVNSTTGLLTLDSTFRAYNGEGRLKYLKGFELNTDKVYLTNLFYYQDELEELELRIKDGAELMTNYVFRNCPKLKRFTIRSKNGGDIFMSAEKSSSLYLAYTCAALEEIDISCLNMTKFEGTGYNCYAFYSCAALSKIYAQEWAVQNSFINGARYTFQSLSAKLTGWTSSKTGGEYAKWRENGGYFTRPLTYETDPPQTDGDSTECNCGLSPEIITALIRIAKHVDEIDPQ